MPQPEWESLAREVRDLAERVASMEQRLRLAEARVTPAEAPSETIEAVAEESGVLASSQPLEQAVGLLPLVGRALLGMAGAYLLRALSESGALPDHVGIAAGIVYAGGWLMWAARVPAKETLAAAVYSLTAATVLVPLLWEATVSLHAISAGTAGATLFLFAVFGMTVSWHKNLLVVSTIATLAALGAGVALLLGTHDVLPLTFLFLAIAAAVEASACLDHWLNERWLTAVTADLSVLLATWLVTNDRGLPETYAAIPHLWLFGAQVALLAIYLASTIVRTLLRGFNFTLFETAQVGFAFLISVSGGLSLSRADARLAPVMATLALTCAAACYLVSFARLERKVGPGRNFYTYSTFGILLALAGSRILLSGVELAGVWSALAVAGIWAGGRFGRLTLQVHGGIYLLLALAVSGAPQQAAAFLLGSAEWPGARLDALLFGALTAALAYGLAIGYRRRAGASLSSDTLRLVLAATFLGLAAGIFAGGLTGLHHAISGPGASHAYCATLRTSVIVIAAVLLAWLGPRFERLELTRLVYPAMALGGYRLLTEDLHQDRKVALFLSLLIYGATLTALPRLRRTASQ
ncbi:MAG: hypothetical protein ACLQPN_04930 [Bryobacteraceae bacterium]